GHGQLKRMDDWAEASDGYCKSSQRCRSRGDAEQRAAHGNGELERRAGESRDHAGGRWTKAFVARQAGEVHGKQADGHRRSFRRDQGTHRWLLDVAGAVHGGGGRVAETLPESYAWRI